jgi:hypothetical protein
VSTTTRSGSGQRTRSHGFLPSTLRDGRGDVPDGGTLLPCRRSLLVRYVDIERVIQLVDRPSNHGLAHRRVRLHRRADVGVTKEFLSGLRMHALARQQACVDLPQMVKAAAFDVRPLQGPVPHLLNKTVRERAAFLRREYESVVYPSLTRLLALLVLQASVRREDVHGARWDRDGPLAGLLFGSATVPVRRRVRRT